MGAKLKVRGLSRVGASWLLDIAGPGGLSIAGTPEVPLLVASGAGAGSRHSIGTGVFFGMLLATTVGIFFIPSFFAEIRLLTERGLRRRPAVAPDPMPSAGDD